MKKKINTVGKTILAQRIIKNIKEEKNFSLSKNDVSMVLDKMWEEIISSLKNREEVRLIGYCSFKLIDTKERNAINLKTKKKIVVPARTVPRAKISQAFKKRIISSFGQQ